MKGPSNEKEEKQSGSHRRIQDAERREDWKKKKAFPLPTNARKPASVLPCARARLRAWSWGSITDITYDGTYTGDKA